MVKKVKKVVHVPHKQLNVVMQRLNLNAVELGAKSGVDHSLISKWQQGVRPVSRRSNQLPVVCATLIKLARGKALDDLIAPFRQKGVKKEEALLAYLVTDQQEGLSLQSKKPERKKTGVYMAQYRVFLGKKGFRQAGLETLDYALTLPPSTLTVLAQGRFEWFTGSIPYLLRFLGKLKKVFKHGTRMQMINRRG